MEEKLKEIEKQKAEVERLNNLMVDRELRMTELKKENEELKKLAKKVEYLINALCGSN